MTTTINASNSGSGGLVQTADASGILALQTAGTTAVTINASQNVGIGTTAINGKFNVSNGGATGIEIFVADGSSTNNSILSFNRSSSAYNDLKISASTTVFTISGSEAARIDSSSNVGIGTTSPNAKLEIKAASASQRQLQLTHFNSTDGWYFTADDTGGVLKTSRAGSSGLNGEAMRIDSSGNVLVNNTGFSSGKFQLYQNAGGTSYAQQIFWEYASGTGYFIEFLRRNSGSNNAVGTIQASTTNVSYNTSSDYRLKENIAPMTGALAKVALLKPVTYQWKIDGSDGEGFLAHELQEICPHAATGEKDGVDEKGNPRYQGIDTSFLVATLTAAIQEQQALITSLTARIAALEGTPA